MASEPAQINDGQKGEEHGSDSPGAIPNGTVYAYNLDDSKIPGGLKVRWKVRVVTGPDAARYDARQAEAIRGDTEMGSPSPRPAPRYAEPVTSTDDPAARVPVATLARTSTLYMQDPAASLRRQVREIQAKLPPGWFIPAHYWDIESGGLDIEQRGHGQAHEQIPDVGIARDGGLAAMPGS